MGTGDQIVRLTEGKKPSSGSGMKPSAKSKPVTYRGGAQPKAPAGPKPAVKPGLKK